MFPKNHTWMSTQHSEIFIILAILPSSSIKSHLCCAEELGIPSVMKEGGWKLLHYGAKPFSTLAKILKARNNLNSVWWAVFSKITHTDAFHLSFSAFALHVIVFWPQSEYFPHHNCISSLALSKSLFFPSSAEDGQTSEWAESVASFSLYRYCWCQVLCG